MIPGTDLYEFQKGLRQVNQDIGTLGLNLLDVTEGDTSIHPEVRATFNAMLSGACLILTQLEDLVKLPDANRSLF